MYLSGTRRERSPLDLAEHLPCDRHGGGSTCQSPDEQRGDEGLSELRVIERVYGVCRNGMEKLRKFEAKLQAQIQVQGAHGLCRVKVSPGSVQP